jgi:hypothetical protein
MAHRDPILAVLKLLPKLQPRQDSTTDQLRDLYLVANQLGMYDAADVLKKLLEKK